jgi:hypothetical protein
MCTYGHFVIHVPLVLESSINTRYTCIHLITSNTLRIYTPYTYTTLLNNLNNPPYIRPTYTTAYDHSNGRYCCGGETCEDKDCNGFAVWSCFGYLHACDKCHAYAQLQNLMDFSTEPYV